MILDQETIGKREYKAVQGIGMGANCFDVRYQPINPKTGKPWQAYRSISRHLSEQEARCAYDKVVTAARAKLKAATPAKGRNSSGSRGYAPPDEAVRRKETRDDKSTNEIGPDH